MRRCSAVRRRRILASFARDVAAQSPALASHPDRAVCTRFRVAEYAARSPSKESTKPCTALDNDSFARPYGSALA
jgi:hypothetical protein